MSFGKYTRHDTVEHGRYYSAETDTYISEIFYQEWSVDAATSRRWKTEKSWFLRIYTKDRVKLREDDGPTKKSLIEAADKWLEWKLAHKGMLR